MRLRRRILTTDAHELRKPRERGNANQKRKIRVYSRALAIENPFLESRRLKNLRKSAQSVDQQLD